MSNNGSMMAKSNSSFPSFVFILLKSYLALHMVLMNVNAEIK